MTPPPPRFSAGNPPLQPHDLPVALHLPRVSISLPLLHPQRPGGALPSTPFLLLIPRFSLENFSSHPTPSKTLSQDGASFLPTPAADFSLTLSTTDHQLHIPSMGTEHPEPGRWDQTTWASGQAWSL